MAPRNSDRAPSPARRGPSGRPHPAAAGGFTIIEVLIALSLLFTLITFLLVALKGRENEGRTSSKFLNAVMLAQKIADDLENRTRENPHAIEKLAALTPEGTAVDAGSEFFRYLEDTTADGTLGEDAPITAASGSLHAQFKDYRFRVSFDRAAGNGLARARILVMWEDRGRRKNYEMTTLLPDLPARIDAGAPADYDEPIDEATVVEALFREAGTLDDLCARYRIDRPLAVELAKVRRICRAVAERLAQAERDDVALERSARGETSAGIAARADLREANGILILRAHRALARPMGEIDARLTAGTLDMGDLHANSCAVLLVKDFALLAKSVDGRANRDCLAIRFNLELSLAMTHLLRLAADPRVAASLPWRERTAALTRLVELGSVLVQGSGDRIVLALGEAKITLPQLVENAFAVLSKLLGGRDYNKADYVAEKLKAIRHRRFSEYEDVSDRIALMNAVAGIAGKLLQAERAAP